MKKEQIKPVLIVGAGPTGMTAAMELSRMGIPVRIIDKAKGPSTTSRALAVQTRTIELMELRGLSEKMLEKGNRAQATTIYSAEQILGKVNLNLIPSRYNFCLLLPQSDTEEILRNQLEKQNINIEWQTEMTDLCVLRNADRVIATIKGPDKPLHEFEASYLIGAEGAHSITRKTLGIEFQGKTMGQNYALGDLHIDGNIPDHELSIFMGKKGFLAVFPLKGQRFRLMVTDPEGKDKNTEPPSLEYLQQLYDAVVHIPGKLYDVRWTSRFGINSRMVRTLRSGNVFLGGDTAHVHSPAGGQGMNTGMQDMINLCWKLAYVIKGQAKPEILDTYEEERIPIIASLLSTTERATDLFNSTNSIVQSLIKAFLPPILSIGAVQKKGAAVVGEIAHSYHGSALAKSTEEVKDLRAGDRLPNWDFETEAVSADGSVSKTGTLYQLLDPSFFTLLLLNCEEQIVIPDACMAVVKTWHLANSSITINDILDDSPAYILVRPDAYIAIAGSCDELEELHDWLKKWLLI